MRRISYILFIALLLAAPAFGQRLTKKQLTIYDMFGDEVTDLTSMNVQNAGTGTSSTIYSDRMGNTSMTNPIVSGMSSGTISFWSKDADYKITITDGTDSLTVDNMTGSQTRVPFWGGYLGSLSSYNLGDGDDLVFGTDSDWVVDCDTTTRLDFIPKGDSYIFAIGDGTAQSDFYVYSTSAKYTYFDESAAEDNYVDIDLNLDDNAKLNFGSSTDVEFLYDGSGNDLNILSTTALDEISFGATGDGYDIVWHSTTAGDYVIFDYSGDAILLEDLSLAMGEGEKILFGDTLGTGDLYIEGTADVLSIDVVSPGTGSIAIGNDADDVPLVWYAETTGAETTFTGDDIQVDGMSLCMGEDDAIQFGDALGTGQMSISIDSADLLTVGQIAAGTGAMALGVDDAGVDFTLYGDTVTQKAWWDASGDQWYWGATGEGVDVTWYADTAGNFMMWDETDEALEFVDCGIKLDATSSILNAPIVVTDAATYTCLATSSGKTHVIAVLSQDTAIKLPASAGAGGEYFRFIFVGGAADSDDHTIDTQSDTNFFIGGVTFIDEDAGAGSDELSVVYSDGNSNSKLKLNNMEAGTVVEVYSNGTNWYVSGIVISDTTPSMADQS